MTNPESPSFFSRLPSIVWIFIIIGGIVLLIGGAILFFGALATVEGFASLLMIAITWGILRASDSPLNRQKLPSAWLAGGIIFFALMGLALDQTGNLIYNYPMQALFCPEKTELSRGIDVTHPKPGQTNISQDFTCVNNDNQVVKSLGILEIIGVRFVEYIFIGYGLVYLNRLYSAFKFGRQRT